MTTTMSDAVAQDRPTHTPAPAAAPEPPRDGVHDFDFLHGTWRIHNRKLRDRLSGSTDWYEFEGRSIERPLWGGRANIEEYDATLPDGSEIHGLALRLYDVKTQRWTIHWSSSATGTLEPTMTGTFRNGLGEFFSHEDFQGRMILVRFHWTNPAPGAARWEQAFSADGGRTWETNWIMEFTRTGEVDGAAPAPTGNAGRCCPIVELRQYTLHPGQRETLIDLFDRELVETQEATGMTVIAQFRDIDRPDVFTWLRGFPDMRSRARALEAFYTGPIWARHRQAANATMISSENVRLLHPAGAGSGFLLGDRAAPDATTPQPGLVVATIYTLNQPAARGFREFFDQAIAPLLSANGARPFAVFETEQSTNTFPRLPVREGEQAFVWFARFDSVAGYDQHVRGLAADRRWITQVRPELDRRLSTPAEIWRLTPTARSRPLR